MFVVCGTFDNEGGRPSYIGKQLIRDLGAEGINGGSLEQLKTFDFTQTDVLVWMPNIDNSEDKIIDTIKSYNPTLILVSSKRIIEGDYTDSDVIGRLLKNHANLGIVFDKDEEGYKFKLLDPLGNNYCDTREVGELAAALKTRIDFVKGLSRMRSVQIGETRSSFIPQHFIDIIQSSGTEFTKYVNAINPNRLLGNASTRCSYGFPAMKEDERIMVSRRNVDKETMTTADFVEVELNDGQIQYFGDVKPSVDTPVQLKLFQHFKNVKYMLHGHVYIQNAPTTHAKIPCGYLEEYDDILEVIIDPEAANFTVNLLGHGCLIAANTLDFFDTVEFMARPFPEA